jgi:hypothetical protein
MECPVCKTEMEKGAIYSYGQIWKKGVPKGIGIAKWISRGGKFIFAFRCPKCKKIELESDS